MEHKLKIWPEFLCPVLSGKKTFELRKNDRDFQVGDLIRLQEWSEEQGYTGREICTIITYILSHSSILKDGWVILALSLSQEGTKKWKS